MEQLLELEYKLSWRSLHVAALYAASFAIVVSGLRATAGSSPLNCDLLLFGDLLVYAYTPLSVFLAAFASFAFSRSVAGQISSGIVKSALALPVKRSRLLLAKHLLFLLVAVPAVAAPFTYSTLVFGLSFKALLAFATVFLLKLCFYASLTTLLSLLYREASASFISSLLLLLAIEALPGFLRSLGARGAADALDFAKAIEYLYDGSGLSAPLLIFAAAAACLAAVGYLLFCEMDLD